MPRWTHGFAGAAALVAAWWIASVALDARVLPSPDAVLARLWQLSGDELWRHAGASLLRVLAGLAVAGASAAPLGMVMGRSQTVDLLLSPIAYLVYPIPKIALLPVVLLLIGIGNGAKVLLLALVLFFQVLISARDASRAVEAQHILTIRSLGGNRLDILRFVIWPNVLPRLLTALRIGSATALAVLFFAETFFTTYGLGYFIVNEWSKIDYVDMFAGIVALALLGVLLFGAIDLAERLLCPWSGPRLRPRHRRGETRHSR